MQLMPLPCNFSCATLGKRTPIENKFVKITFTDINHTVNEYIEFQSWKELLSWKEEEESTTCVYFVQPKESIQSSGINYIIISMHT